MSRQESQISALFGGAKGTVMELRSGRLVAFMGAVLLLAGCATTRNATGDEAGNRSDVRFERGGFVLDGRALEDGPGTIVGTLSGKIPNFRLQRTPGNTHECPRITLRNSVTFSGFANPHVYVDGIRTTDTCVLTQLKTNLF